VRYELFNNILNLLANKQKLFLE